MRIKHYITFFLPLLAIALIASTMTSGLAPIERTGAPGEMNCSACHFGATPNTGAGLQNMILNSGATSYIPGDTHNISYFTADPNQVRFGFSMTALDVATHSPAGTFILTNTTNSMLQTSATTGRQYVSHKTASTNNIWQFKWVAPATGTGSVKFYASSNHANNNFQITGDTVYVDSFLYEPVECGRDIFEPNDMQSTAAPLPTVGVFYNARVCTGGDEDWYYIDVSSPKNNIKANLDALTANLDLDLYNSAGTRIRRSSNGGISLEELTYANLTAGRYYLRVYSTSNEWSEEGYILKLTRSSSAYGLPGTPGTPRKGEVLYSREDQPKAIQLNIYPNPATKYFELSAEASAQGFATITMRNLKGQEVINHIHPITEGKNTIRLPLDFVPRGFYWVQYEEGGVKTTKSIMVK